MIICFISPTYIIKIKLLYIHRRSGCWRYTLFLAALMLVAQSQLFVYKKDIMHLQSLYYIVGEYDCKLLLLIEWERF